MAQKQSMGQRWETYRPSKGAWFWSCVGCVAGTMLVGFVWGGWVTGGTARNMAANAADAARTQLAASVCVGRFDQGPDMATQIAALKKADSYNRGDMLTKEGWVTLPGSKTPIDGVSDLCAQRLVSKAPTVTAKG